MNRIKIGDTMPSIELNDSDPNVKVNIAEICQQSKVIILGVPGAFTPGCTKAHLPGYIEKADDFKKKGFSDIICVSVNDTYVLTAWSKFLGAQGKVRMLADLTGEFTKAIGLDTNLLILGGIRSRRYSMVVEKGIVVELNVEPDDSGTGLTCSLAEKLKYK